MTVHVLGCNFKKYKMRSSCWVGIFLALLVNISHAASEGAPDQSASPQQLLPDMFQSHRTWTSAPNNQVFPNTVGGYAYVSLCGYQTLSLDKRESKECIVLALSLLLTSPKHSLVLLIPTKAVISSDFQKIATALNIQLYRYENIFLPDYAISYHHKKGSSNWITSYQKLHILNLTDYKRVFFIDSDHVINRNIDHIFDIPGDKIGGDCLPHSNYWNHSMLYKPGPNGGLTLISPNTNKFQKVVNLLAQGVTYDAAGVPVAWKYPKADQDLLEDTVEFKDVTYLDCYYQTFPDICTIAKHPLIYYPPAKFYLFHYTWAHPKGELVSNEFYSGRGFQRRKSRFGWTDNDYNYHMECMQIFAFSYKHFSNLTSVITEHLRSEASPGVLPLNTLLQHPSVSFSNWIDIRYDKKAIKYFKTSV